MRTRCLVCFFEFCGYTDSGKAIHRCIGCNAVKYGDWEVCDKPKPEEGRTDASDNQ